MDNLIRLEPLTENNFETFATMIQCEDAGCYCSFWHQKWASMEEWDKRKSEEPEKNKACMLEKVRSKFHLGVLAFCGSESVAWISVGPVPEFYWSWRRVGSLGDDAKTIAAIPCITRKTEWRDRIKESDLLRALIPYAKNQGWSALEGYPFDRKALDNMGDAITWPGIPEAFLEAGFERIAPHWLNSPEYPRSIYRISI